MLHHSAKPVDQIVYVHGVKILFAGAHCEESAFREHLEHLQHAEIPRTIHRARPDDDDLHVRVGHHPPACAFGLELRLLVQIARIERGFLVFRGLAHVAVNANGRAVDESADSRAARCIQRVDRSTDVDFPVALRGPRSGAEIRHQVQHHIRALHQLSHRGFVIHVRQDNSVRTTFKLFGLLGVAGKNVYPVPVRDEPFCQMASQEPGGPGHCDCSWLCVHCC